MFVGIDQSLTNTAVCAVNNSRIFQIKSIPTRPSEKVPMVARIGEVALAVTNFIEKLPTVTLVAIEGYSLGSHSSRLDALHELGGVIKHSLYLKKIPFTIVPPTVVKKFATKRGNASKEMIEFIANKEGIVLNNSDEYDAYYLAMYASHFSNSSSISIVR